MFDSQLKEAQEEDTGEGDTSKKKTQEPHFVNLNEDPMLSNVIYHFISKSETTIGRKGGDTEPDICLSGLRLVSHSTATTLLLPPCSYSPVPTTLLLPPCSYGPVPTALFLPPCSYSPVPTALFLQPCSYSPVPTTLLLQSCQRLYQGRSRGLLSE